MVSQSMVARFRGKLRGRGLGSIVRDRLRWYRKRFEMDNWLIGRAIELTGNRVRMYGLKFSVDNPLIATPSKSTLFFGRYEVEEVALARRHLDPDIPVVELGGSIGVVACVTNRLLSRPERHVVVEANPAVVPTLEANRALNGARFVIENAAVAYDTDEIEFTVDGQFHSNRVDGAGKTARVPTVSLARLLEKYDFPTINLVSDIEGAEIELVEHEGPLLRDRVRTILMETHDWLRGEEKVSAMLATLGKLGFDRIDREGSGKTDVVALINRNFG